MEDYIRGVIYGTVIGDALGLSTEFMTLDNVKEHYPNTEIFTYDGIHQDYHRKTWKKGDWTDDSDQMIVVMKTIMESSGSTIDIKKFSENLLDWVDNGIPECDDTKSHGTGNTLSIFWGDKYAKSNPHLAGLRTYIYNPYYPLSNNSNGAIMRAAIIATFNSVSLDVVMKNTINICKVTHPSPLCVYTSLIVNYIVSTLITNNNRDYNFVIDTIHKSVSYVQNIMQQYIYDITNDINTLYQDIDENDEMKSTIQENITKNFPSFHFQNQLFKLTNIITNSIYEDNIQMVDLNTNIGYTAHPLTCAIYALRKIAEKNMSFEQILSTIIKQGGDADTNCAVAGAVLGAYLGKSQITPDYINKLAYKDYLDKSVDNYINFLDL
jgi:ADP-ribosylglycohydrolase